MEPHCKLWGNLCSPPLHMPHKLQSSILDSLVKYSHMGSILEALQGLHSLKVIHAEMTQNGKGSPSFRELGQTYLNINVDTANVYYILSKARDAFNDPSLELVSSNGLRIMDNEGTKGYY